MRRVDIGPSYQTHCPQRAASIRRPYCAYLRSICVGPNRGVHEAGMVSMLAVFVRDEIHVLTGIHAAVE
jgi:hypothetical protein